MITEYIRTIILKKILFKRLDSSLPYVYISDKELSNYNDSTLPLRDILNFLIGNGSLIKRGSYYTLPYNSLNGDIIPSLLGVEYYTEYFRFLISNFNRVSGNVDEPRYNMYLSLRERYKDIANYWFSKEDAFANRVHSVFTSMKRENRMKLLIDDEQVIEIDVHQSQPSLFSYILESHIGNNIFSNICKEQDIYEYIRLRFRLKDREIAKTKLYYYLYGNTNELDSLFGEKVSMFLRENKKGYNYDNPHTFVKPYSNIAYLLQRKEVEIMSSIWKELLRVNIPFITIHDGILVPISQREIAYDIMLSEYTKHISYGRLKIKG